MVPPARCPKTTHRTAHVEALKATSERDLQWMLNRANFVRHLAKVLLKTRPVIGSIGDFRVPTLAGLPRALKYDSDSRRGPACPACWRQP